MDKNKLRAFAVAARQELLQRVADRAAIFGIDEKRSAAGALAPSESYQKIDGSPLTREEARQRDALLAAVGARGFAQAVEEAAYTWFNRLIALRYMQAHDLLPVRARVLPDAPGHLPQLVAEAQRADVGLPPERVLALLERSRTDELYKLQLIRLCNLLSESLPRVFEPIGDYTELLFPDGLLRPDSVLGMMSALPPDSWDDIEAVGWLYQYYNAQLKDETFELLRKNVKITKERIGPATQLFTPEWIVRYMVENSVGRLWLEGHPDAALRAKWRYYLDEAEQEPETAAQLASLRRDAAALRPEEIAVLDPCMGSGHILVAAFDLLMDIYRAQGYVDRDAARLIVERNLYGLDIDERAAQLAYFAVMMKACEFDRRFLRRGVAPNVMPVAESDPRDEALLSRFGELEDAARRVWEAFLDAKEYGSLLHVDTTLQELDALEKRAGELAQADDLLGHAAAKALLPLIRQAKLLARRYDAVVTNPPYMGSSNMDEKLSRFVKEHYPDGKSDMSTAMMERALEMTEQRGYMAMINIPVWMFLSSFEKLRKKLLKNSTYVNMVHPGRGIFGSDFGTTAFVITKQHIPGYNGNYRRLFDVQGEVKGVEERKRAFLDGKGKYIACQDNFSKIPGAPVAYWVPLGLVELFGKDESLQKYPGFHGLLTGNDERFIRSWPEVDFSQIDFRARNIDDFDAVGKWYIPLNKGGAFRKWYGNKELVVRFDSIGRDLIKQQATHGFGGFEWYCKSGITWSEITSYKFSPRYANEGSIFSLKGPTIFPDNKNFLYVFGFLSTNAANYIIKLLNPTISCGIGVVQRVPYCYIDKFANAVDPLVKQSIALSRADWDSFETSWDFGRHPLI